MSLAGVSWPQTQVSRTERKTENNPGGQLNENTQNLYMRFKGLSPWRFSIHSSADRVTNMSARSRKQKQGVDSLWAQGVMQEWVFCYTSLN